MRVMTFNLGPLDNNTYLIIEEDGAEAAIVDPTFESQFILREVESRGLTLRYVLNTHAHIDHVIENAFFTQSGNVPLALHPLDLPLLNAIDQQALWLGITPPEVVRPTIQLQNAQQIPLGRHRLTVLHTPGHSPGHVCFLADDFVVSGDVLFQGSIGRTDLPGGNHDQLIASIRQSLLPLPDPITIYPGHGPNTTIGEERRSNPFLI